MKRLLAIAALIAFCGSPCFAQPQIDYSKFEIKTTDLGHGLYLLNWQGGDSLFLVGDDGVLLVDTAVAQLGDKIKLAIARVSPKPIKFVINTHAHADHFGANEAMAKTGALIIGHTLLRERMAKGQYLAAFNQTIPPSPPAALPVLTYTDTMTIHFGDETVELIHVPSAHMDNDTLVHFKRANVIHASGTIGGDGGYPFFDMSGGGSLAGTIVAEDKMLELADANTKIIADEGEPASTKLLKASRDALVMIRSRVQKLIDEGKDEAQTIAAKPSKDLDAQWVHQGNMSGDAITRMAFQSLKSSH